MALLAAYSFDEASGDFLDYSGNGRDWTPNNNAVRTAGHTGNGLTKNGVGMPVVAEPAFGQTPARTFMFWQQSTGDAVWWLRWHTSDGDTGTWGLYNLSGNLTLRLRKGGTNTNTSVATPADGSWHHYAGTYDGTNARLYVDGVLVATSAAVTAPLDSAGRIDLAEGTLPNFVMDDLRVYDEALDQPTIAALMDTPVTADETPSGEGTAELTITPSGVGAKTATAAASTALNLSAVGAGGAVRGGQATASLQLVATGVGQAHRPGEAAAAFALIDLAMTGVGRKTTTGSAAATLTITTSGVAAATRGASGPLARTTTSASALKRTAPSARGA